jgi:hypothetical protein
MWSSSEGSVFVIIGLACSISQIDFETAVNASLVQTAGISDHATCFVQNPSGC